MGQEDRRDGSAGLFLMEMFELTEEQTRAVWHWIPMTQEIYSSILEKCMEAGKSADSLLSRMLEEYPDKAAVYAEEIEKEAEKKDVFEISTREWEKLRQDVYERIIEKLA